MKGKSEDTFQSINSESGEEAIQEEVVEDEDYVYDVDIEVVLLKGGKLPAYSKDGSSGMDVYARLYDIETEGHYVKRQYSHDELNGDNTLTIYPGRQVLVDAGFKCNIPYGFEIQVRPRSGLALKSMISVSNSPGTIDCGYLDPVGIILFNYGNKPFVIKQHDRIAQIVLQQVPRIVWNEVDEFDSDTFNREGGFGSTGV